MLLNLQFQMNINSKRAIALKFILLRHLRKQNQKEIFFDSLNGF